MTDAVERPNYYVMPTGAETIDISQWLTSAGGQAVQYIVRATRTDGVVKANPVQDIDKAIYWLNIERQRLTFLQDGRDAPEPEPTEDELALQAEKEADPELEGLLARQAELEAQMVKQGKVKK